MEKKYDYIIVGAGSSGCVMANRLSEDPSNTVLLIEAGGPDKHPYIHMPGGYGKNHRSKRDWGFWTTPQKHANNRRIYLPRGKTLGGSSSTNAMAYVRGNKHDYDHWSQLGNRGWSYDDVLPLFKKSECNANISELDAPFHSDQGELKVSFQKAFRTKYAQAFIDSCTEWGLNANQDYNGSHQRGVGEFQFTIADGKRQSTAVAFLKPIMNRPNLTISTHSHVTKLHIKNDEAIGLSFKKGNVTSVVLVNKDIILSAGAFQSPQLLLLSGIGPKDHLKSHGIDVIQDLPGVGQNLQDHLFYGVTADTKMNDGVNHYLSIPGQLKGLWSYLMYKKGPLACSLLEAVAFLNVDHPDEEVNFQLHFAPISFGEGYEYDAYDIKTYPHKDGVSILPTLLHPQSRGEVTLSSQDPLSAPVISPKFLSKEKDLEQLVKGGKIALELFKQSSFSSHLNKIIAPLQHDTEADLVEHIKKSVETVYHPVGTCKMGHDEMAVVDDELRVSGIGKLRVVDASIMPKIITGNTNAACIMIAEKAANMILNQAKIVRKESTIMAQ